MCIKIAAMRIQLSRAAYDLLKTVDPSRRMSEVRDKEYFTIFSHRLNILVFGIGSLKPD